MQYFFENLMMNGIVLLYDLFMQSGFKFLGMGLTVGIIELTHR